MDVIDALGGEEQAAEPVHAVFMLVSPEEDHRQHLRMLAHLANRIDEDHFMDRWQQASSAAHLKELLLEDAHYLTLRLRSNELTADLIGKALREIDLPDNTLVAIVRRGDDMIIPRGNAVLEENDRVTIIGAPEALRRLRSAYLDGP